MKNLYKYSQFSEYAKYLVTNYSSEAPNLLKKNIIDNLGYLLKFLSSRKTFIIADSYNVMCYNTSRDNIFFETNNKTETDLMLLYSLGIEKSFEFLDTPF